MKAKSLFSALLLGIGTLTITASLPAQESITEKELIRRAQELFDAVAAGNKEPWRKYIAEDCLYFDEKGRDMDKAALVADVTPLPTGFSGVIKVVRAKSRIAQDVAILSYELDETELVYGQVLTARYHATDTWRLRNGVWQIAAGQVLRYYEDPPAGRADPAKYPDYTGNYELAPGVPLKVSVVNGQLQLQRGNAAPVALILEAPDLFFRKGVEGRVLFRRDDHGKVDACIVRRNNEDIVWRKIE
ncbi:MAG: DUF4440 domain-containing protein [Opitutae bacterium]|nr:DUF4440 domain-containing protein [Opitutae bacterium]